MLTVVHHASLSLSGGPWDIESVYIARLTSILNRGQQPSLVMKLTNTRMQYHQFMIYIHRPFISKYRSQPYPPVGPGYNHARTTCIESAVAISKLLTKYKSAYTLRLINIQAVSIVFSAALILVFATVSEIRGDTNVDPNTHLSTCCKGLAELGKTFQNATRALEILLSIKRAWQAKLLVCVGSKRRSSSIRTHRGSAKKRTIS